MTGSLPAWIEWAAPSDVPALCALEATCFAPPWTEANFHGALREEDGSRILLLREPDGIAGYCCIQVVAGELHVHKVAVREDRRGHGLGSLLVRLALRAGARADVEAAHLEVRAGNEPARALYRRLGFEEVGRRPGYYEGPREDAVLMTRPRSRTGARSPR